ncbi:zinc transporter 9-like [Branchiostoma floridae]|uniref:Proton-coupled zinc antiporter SLC30A9, mitochondrial n=1 Tax=Branchiostoma floridae TaxID=7739 RepID=A0A9J7MW50_BRAFL|nr:zinc transporter 9-like [Branchiostoma floridae]
MRMLRLLRGVAYLRQEVMSQATCAHRQCHTGVCRTYCFCQPVLVSGLTCITNNKVLQTGHTPPQYFAVRHLCSSDSGKTETPKETGKTAAPGGDNKKVSSSKDKLVKTIYRVKPKPRKRIDYSKAYTDNNTITAVRAMSEFLLKPSDLEGLRKTARRSPYSDPNSPPLMVYLRADVEQKAIEVWGSMAALQREMQKREKNSDAQKQYTFRYKKALKEYRKFFGEGGVEPPFIFGSGKPQDRSYLEEPVYSLFSGSGRVVMMAIGINTLNFVFKLVAWVFTGSASMFSEAIHSLADTINQSILAFGIHQSIRKPNPDHPYGFSNMRYVSSLVSGVGIFCVGAGLSIYHGVLGLIDPQPMESFFWAYCILTGSLVSEGATLLAATAHIRKSARAQGMQFMEYVWRSRDPSVNVVLLEDAAAVLGVAIAATCMGLTSLTGNPIYDAVGSITIGGLLAMVSAFLIYTNAEALIGRSIPPDQLDRIMHSLEDDVMVRAIHDIKATEMGLNIVRFKAEVDFDGREVTRSYLDKVDLEALLQEVQQYQTIEDMEGFMLRHGENIIDILGAEVDRLETQLKKKNPEVKHVDLEIL